MMAGGGGMKMTGVTGLSKDQAASNMVAMGEKLCNDALEGTVVAAVLVTMLSTGEVLLHFANTHPVTAVGMLEQAKLSILRAAFK